MELNDYQTLAKATAIYEMPVVYPALGMCGEAGEVAEKVKKVIRDNNSDFSTAEFKEDIKKEIGDVLWYVANMSSDVGLTLQEVAEANVAKLQSRKIRGKIGGSGDNR